MASIHLWTGKNAYALRLERKRWTEQFALKHGPENLVRLDSTDLLFSQFLDEISTAPFIAEKRLVTVSEVPKFSKEEMQAVPGNIHPDCIVVFFDPAPDQRLAGVKELLKIAVLKKFPPLVGKALHAWIDSFLRERESSIDPKARLLLLEIAGEDQTTLANELEKLALHASGNSIQSSDIELLVIPSGERDVFMMTNLLAAGAYREAIHMARFLQERGTSAQSLWAILLWMLRNLALVSASVREGQRNPAKIAQLGIHPASVRTLLPLADHCDATDIRTCIEAAVTEDIDLKTGVYRATVEAPEELQALVDRFIIRCGMLKKRS